MQKARVAVAAICLIFLIASMGAAAEPVKLVFWHIWGGGSPHRLIQEGVEAFNAAHEGEIEVEAVVQDFWTFEDKLQLAMASGLAPDVIQWDIVTAKRRASNDQILDLLPFLEKEGIDPNVFWPPAIDAGRYQGGIYSVPFNTDVRVLYWNKDHFAEAGLDPSRPPKTWADLEQMAPKLTRRASDGKFERVGFHPMWGNVWFLPWAWTNDGQWFADDGRPTIDKNENVEALQWVVNWIHRYGKAELDEFATQFEKGEPFTVELLSMLVHNNQHADFIENNNAGLDFGIAPIPINRTEGSWAAGFDMEILKTGAEEKYAAAWEFVEYMTGEEFMSKWTRNSRSLGARPQVAADAYPNDENWSAAITQMLTAHYTPYSFEVPDWWQITYPHIEAAINLTEDPRVALTKAQQEVMGRYEQAVGK